MKEKLTVEESIQIVKHHLDDLYEKYNEMDKDDVSKAWKEELLYYLNDTVEDLEEFTYELDGEDEDYDIDEEEED